MLHSRIREIRKQKGLTLQEVAERAGTTAQTIGRLETGMRTVSIKWVNRIAGALEVDPAMLLSLPEHGDIEVAGILSKGGQILPKPSGTLSLQIFAVRPVAIKIKTGTGDYRPGDIVVFETEKSDCPEMAIGRDCLVETTAGRQYFAKLAAGKMAGTFSLLSVGHAGTLAEDLKVVRASPAVTLVRALR